MPAKKTAKRAPPRDIRQRMHATAQRHPVVTLSLMATLVGIFVSLGPAALWAVNYYQTRAEAQQNDLAIRTLTKENDAAVRALVAEAQHKADRNLAWASVQSIKTEISVAKNRTNDCQIREQKREQMTTLERSTCNDYSDALSDASKRFDEAKRVALELSK